MTTNNWKIVILFDMSGSMENFMEKTPTAVDTINEFIKIQKEEQNEGSNVNMSLYFFNDLLTNVFEDKALKDVSFVKESDYNPDGTTGLLDAIGKTINKYKQETNVYFVILTDGFENASVEYNSRDINLLITTQKNNGWKFNFLGTNQDSWNVGNKMGLARNDCMNYENSSEGLISSFRQVGTMVRQSTQPNNV